MPVEIQINIIDTEDDDSPFHNWGDEDFDWKGLDKAIDFLDRNLRKWRIQVRQSKEKYGTARIYCSLGIESLYCLFHPGWVFYRWPKWTCKITRRPSWLYGMVNTLIIPIHMMVYRYYYERAVKKWPHLRQEILSCADYSELLKGL